MRRVPHHPVFGAVFAVHAIALCIGLAGTSASFAAAVVVMPTALDHEGVFRAGAKPLMNLTVGPTVGEAAGLPRWDTGPNPRTSDITLTLPELRSASSLAVLQQALRWNSLLAEMHRGDRAMADYWSTGSIDQGQAQFSMLRLGVDMLNSETPRRGMRAPEPEAVAALGGIARAAFLTSSGGSGGGGGGSGGRNGLQLPVYPPSVDGIGPIVDPDTIPAPPNPGSPPQDDVPATPGTGGTQPVVIIFDFGDLSWVNPAFASNPQPVPPPGGDPFDNDQGRPVSSGTAMIPAPSPLLLASAGLCGIAMGAQRRRKA